MLWVAFSFVGGRVRVPAKRKWKLHCTSAANRRATVDRLQLHAAVHIKVGCFYITVFSFELRTTKVTKRIKSPGLLQLRAVRHHWQSFSTSPVGTERGGQADYANRSTWPYLTCVDSKLAILMFKSLTYGQAPQYLSEECQLVHVSCRLWSSNTFMPLTKTRPDRSFAIWPVRVDDYVRFKRKIDLYSAPSWEARLWSARVWITQLLHCKHTIPAFIS